MSGVERDVKDDDSRLVWVWNNVESYWWLCKAHTAIYYKQKYPERYGEIIEVDMANLSFDVARCPGVKMENYYIGDHHVLTWADPCEHCRRREPGRPEYQTYIAPAWTEDNGCQNEIQPRPPDNTKAHEEACFTPIPWSAMLHGPLYILEVDCDNSFMV